MARLTFEEAVQNQSMGTLRSDESARKGKSLAHKMGREWRLHASALEHRKISDKLNSSRTTTGAHTSQVQQLLQRKKLSQPSRLDAPVSDSTRNWTNAKPKEQGCHYIDDHKDVKTTMIYTHVLNRGSSGVRSPLDGH